MPENTPPRLCNAIADRLTQRISALRNVPYMEIIGRRRSKTIVEARHLVWWTVRKTTCFSYPEIGRIFGVDHTSIVHACRKIDARRSRDVRFFHVTEDLITD